MVFLQEPYSNMPLTARKFSLIMRQLFDSILELFCDSMRVELEHFVLFSDNLATTKRRFSYENRIAHAAVG
jgi:hypothetical protein